MATITISQEEAARDLAGLLARLNEDTQIVIENGSLPVAVVHAAPRAVPKMATTFVDPHSAVLDEDWPAELDALIESRREPLKIWE